MMSSSTPSNTAALQNHLKSQLPPRIHLLLENPKKSNNLGPILRCAAAFGVSQVVAVGFEKCSVEGAHGAAKHVSIIAFPTIDQAVSYLRNEKECISLIGLLGGVPDAYDTGGYCVAEENETLFVSPTESNSTKRSFPIHTRPFVDGNCCFVICKNTRGLPKRLASQCDFFVHVPHVNTVGEDDDVKSSWLVDAPSCLSICLHHFTAWAQYSERGFEGHKYEVGQTRQRNEEEREAIRLARAKAREQAASSDDGVGTNSAVDMFATEQAHNGDY